MATIITILNLIFDYLCIPPAGGTQITIAGYGFPCDEDFTNTNVNMGSQICRIISICHNEIICKITMETVSLFYLDHL